MSDEKHVLVLLYDEKDGQQVVKVHGKETTIRDEIERGFQGTSVKYEIRDASPRHLKWVALDYFNERRYDGIIIVAGLSCSFDMPGSLMERLRDEPTIHIEPSDWQNVPIDADGKIITYAQKQPKGRLDFKFDLKSKYYKQRTVPIIGVPTWDDITYGESALHSMLMSSRPSDAACVPVQKAYQAARLMAKLISTPWNDVGIIVPDTHVLEYNDDRTPKKRSPGFQTGFQISSMLDKAFMPFEDAKISFGCESIDDYLRGLALDSQPRFRIGNSQPRTIHVCVYETFDQLVEVSKAAELVIGVFAPPIGPRVDLLTFNDIVSHIGGGLENVIHSRIGAEKGENAAFLVAHALYASNPTLKPERFTEYKRDKHKGPVERYRQRKKEQGKDFEVKP